VYTLLGILATVIMQSSHATLVLTLTALGAGQVSYANALALAIGANVGTTITAVLGALGANVDGRRLAGAHVLFNVVTGLVAILAIQPLMRVVEWLARELGLAADDYTLRLAIFHTLFNLIGVLIMLPLLRSMVGWLRRLIRVTEPERVRPRYLSEAVLEVPDAALAAMRKEVVHLYQRAFGVLAHGLALHRETILSDYDLEQMIQAPPRRGEYDIEAHYEQELKLLYSEIIAFASRLRTELSQERSEALYELRNAARGIVEAVKEVKHMRHNLVRYTGHASPDIRAEYNRLRAMLALVLRQVYRVGVEHSQDVTVLSLDRLKVDVREMDKALDDRLADLIRSHRVTPEMATSLMNDSAYAFSAVKALLNAGYALSSTDSEAQRKAERAVRLDPDEIERVLSDEDERA
jgi:phosphate:Na+ symporter